MYLVNTLFLGQTVSGDALDFNGPVSYTGFLP